eukprot:767146-Hanusia_phi.AAC.3
MRAAKKFGSKQDAQQKSEFHPCAIVCIQPLFEECNIGSIDLGNLGSYEGQARLSIGLAHCNCQQGDMGQPEETT